jgi:hypothetical protein
VQMMRLLCTKFVGTNPSYMFAKFVVFEKRFEEKVDAHRYAKPLHKPIYKDSLDRGRKFFCLKKSSYLCIFIISSH